ncbi:TPA: hypothetical protein NEQ15_003518 [Acinetobacter baumannii]|nr:hypothetical protein [Acinetobacter baumannii]
MYNFSIKIFPLICGLLFFSFCCYILNNGHLHEDAYILFQYSRNFASGNGITFDYASGHIEGATDFLWMAAIAFLYKIIGDVALSAIFLNAIGLIIIIQTIIKIRGSLDLISFIASMLVIFSGGLSAAVGGFSTLAYASLYCLLMLSVMNKNFIYITILMIIIPLFRPDGSLIVLGTLIYLCITTELKNRRKLILSLLITVSIGAIYFYWRYTYFGMLLPLPLMVKQKTDFLFEGLINNVKYLSIYLPIFIFTLFFIKKTNYKNAFLVISGPTLLFLALSVMHQSQNIGGRFQYIIIISVILLFTIYVKNIDLKKSIFLIILSLIPITISINKIYKDYIYLTNDDYINNFPQILKKDGFSVKNIAITEAGRFPFWYNTYRMIDLVGLNSKEVVIHGAYATLEKYQPDLIFVHSSGRYNLSKIKNKNRYFFSVDPKNIILNPYSGRNPVGIAPESALKFAIEKNYTAIAVRYGENDTDYSHVYFLNRNIDMSKFQKDLMNSFYEKTTYFNSIK